MSDEFTRKGKVQTVMGLVDPMNLGVVLPHEHLKIDITEAFYKEPKIRPALGEENLSLSNLGWIRQYPYSHKQNMKVQDTPEVESAILHDVFIFKQSGGGTIVDNTTQGMQRAVCFAENVSRETGVNIVAGCGFYVDALANNLIRRLTVEEMCKDNFRDLTKGCMEYTKIKAGILGEIGSSWPITEYEKKALLAAGQTEEDLGCPVMIHPGRNPKAASETMRLYTEAGGNPKRAVMAHLDRTLQKPELLDEFAAEYGCFLEFDLFGTETSFYQQNTTIDFLSDAQRIQLVKHLISEGHLDRILLSHDIHTRHRFEAFGGHGYSHLLNNVRPQMVERGIDIDDINKMMMQNPARWLTFSK